MCIAALMLEQDSAEHYKWPHLPPGFWKRGWKCYTEGLAVVSRGPEAAGVCVGGRGGAGRLQDTRQTLAQGGLSQLGSKTPLLLGSGDPRPCSPGHGCLEHSAGLFQLVRAS